MAENKMITVVDASVILKWILSEELHAENARKIGLRAVAGEIVIFVPEHTYTEVANILAIKGQYNVGEELKIFFDKGFLINVWHTVTVTNKACAIMKKCKGVSFYDAIYHALALEHQGTFITADEKYYRQTKKLGHIMLLKDFPV